MTAAGRRTFRTRALLAAALLMLMASPLLTWTAEPPPEPDETVIIEEALPEETTDSLLELIAKGGPVMIPIILCSIVAVAVAVERFINLRRNRIIPDNFMEGLIEAFGPEGTNTESAMAYCRRTPSPISNVIRAGIAKLGRKLEIVEKAVEDAAAREVFRMRRGLDALSVIGTITPLLGLLGTMYGMIEAFQMAAEKGLGRAETLATGIYEALVTTAAGLTVAVPTLLVYYILVHKVDRLTEQIEQIGNEFLDQCHEETGAEAIHRASGPVPAEPWER